MLSYIIKRILYAIPILIGVNFITFTLFFIVNSPDDMARMHLGSTKATNFEQIEIWKQQHGYNKPLFYNSKSLDDSEASWMDKFTNTLFFQESLKLFSFNFGTSDAGRSIKNDIFERMVPSLMIAIPTFIIGLMTNIIISLLVVFLYATFFDRMVLFISVVLMSISALFYVIFGQLFFSFFLNLFPVSGYSPTVNGIKFLVLPVIIGVVSGIGAGVRWYRTIFLEEINKDFIRTAKAKGLGSARLLFKHLLPNGMLPILTGVVVIIPSLFMGSLIIESFFGIPGLGSYTLDAIASQDFAIVRSMVFLGSFLYIVGLILTDISYIIFDPRVTLN